MIRYLITTACPVPEARAQILNYIEKESIPKEKVREKIKELEILSDNGANAVRFAMCKDDEIERIQKQKDITTIITILQELLGE